jgi:hypothetical protein
MLWLTEPGRAGLANFAHDVADDYALTADLADTA